jgi:hypothetical protein
MRAQAKTLPPLAEKGVASVFLQRRDQDGHKGPFGAGVRWQPAFIVEMDGGKVSHVVDLTKGLPGQPVNANFLIHAP